jgi:hypothetical protein
MRAALTPPYVWLFTKIGQLEGGVKFLVDMRAATIELVSILRVFYFSAEKFTDKLLSFIYGRKCHLEK